MNNPILEDIITDANLLAGWAKVRENQGGPGVDGQTIEQFERKLQSHISTLRNEVHYDTYRPLPLLRVMIPKKSGGERALAIPAVRDRVLQSATAIVLTPLFEAEFEDVSFAYRRGRSVDKAATRVVSLREQGYRWVVDADIHAFFDEVDHRLLLKEVQKLVFDEGILRLIKRWLRARVRDGKHEYRLTRGVPQGSPISPMLANLYLDHLDEALLDENKKLVRYADDFLVLCKSREAAEDALELTEEVLHALHLEINERKTRIVDFNQGFRFLGVQFIRSLAFKLKYNHEQSRFDIRPVKEDEQREPLPQPSPPHVEASTAGLTTIAAAFAEAGIDADDFPDSAPPQPDTTDTIEPEPIEPPDDDAPAITHRLDPLLRTLYLLKHGQVLGKESKRLVIRQNGVIQTEIPTIKVDQILVFGNAQITTQAMQLCLRERIPIYLLSAAGQYYGVIDSFDTEPVLLHKTQFSTAADPDFCLRVARGFIRGKIKNTRTLLNRLARNRRTPQLKQAALSLKRIHKQLDGAVDLDQLRGFEGNAARVYFQAMQATVHPDWQFTGRNRQPPGDPINALLSYGYTLLYYNVYSLIRARGLNPHVGYLHPMRAGHPALASDMVEEFRALVVDAIVWNLVLNNRISPDDFQWPTRPTEGCRMNSHVRTRLIRELEKKLNTPIIYPANGQRLDYRRCIEHQVNHLVAVIRGNTDEYLAMTPK